MEQVSIGQQTTVLHKIPVDADHGGIRFMIILAFIVGLVGGYILVNALLPSAGISLLAMLGGLFTAWGLGQLAETLLRGRWHSGRYLELLPTGVRLATRNQVEANIQQDLPVQILLWRFTVKQRSRIPRGWHMLACALEQNDVYLPVYTFISPDTFDKLPDKDRFVALVSKKQTKQTGGVERDIVLTGQQRRVHLAEQHRWMDGAEVTFEDFSRYLDFLKSQLNRWMPVN